MKRISSLVLAALLVLALSACSAAPAPATPTAPAPAETPAPSPAASDAPAEGSASPAASPEAQEASGGILIAYFSVPETDGVDAVAGASRVVVDGAVLGSNQYVAQLIQAEVGGDLFRIETEQTYPGEHDALLEFAYNELAEGARPALAAQVEDLSRYDVIFLGYPNWNADLPMPLYTFLESVDLSGKTIGPRRQRLLPDDFQHPGTAARRNRDRGRALHLPQQLSRGAERRRGVGAGAGPVNA